MGVLRSLCSALLMYSRLPAPRVEWKEENRRYALCFFPFVGAVIGGLLILWLRLCDFLALKDFLFAAGAAAIPLLVTGGIHMDGFCDVIDAKASCAPREKKLKIMADPHIGAFAVMGLALYLLIQTALFCECREEKAVILLAMGYPLSRALSGLAAVCFRCAKKEGSLQDFVRPAHKRRTVTVLLGEILCLFAAMVWYGRGRGAVQAAAAFLAFAWYRRCSYREFGGITGDLEGYFVQVCELAMLAATLVCGLAFPEF